jgi:hypothetical protein
MLSISFRRPGNLGALKAIKAPNTIDHKLIKNIYSTGTAYSIIIMEARRSKIDLTRHSSLHISTKLKYKQIDARLGECD